MCYEKKLRVHEKRKYTIVNGVKEVKKISMNTKDVNNSKLINVKKRKGK